MSKYWTTLKAEQIDKWNHVLLDKLAFEDDKHGMITVPAGFETDYASIRMLHNVLLFVLYALVAGYGNYSATIHDYLYATNGYTRKECDDVLYRALRAEGVARWRAWIFWAGVRIGGAKAYKLHRKV